MPRASLSPIFFSLLVSVSILAQSPYTAVQSQKPQKSHQQAQTISPQAAILTLTPDVTTVPLNQTVHFTATWNKKMPRMSYQFDWNDGTYSDTEVPTAEHAFPSVRSYTVRVTAKPGLPAFIAAMPSLTSNPVRIQVTQPSTSGGQGSKTPPAPVLTLTGGLEPPEESRTVRIKTSWDRPVYVQRCTIEWGDGSTSNCEQPDTPHTYSAAEVYTIRARAQALADDRNFSVQSNDLPISIAPPPLLPSPTAILDAEPRRVLIGSSVSFTASTNPATEGAQYQFTFDDGTEGLSTSNPTTTHIYRAARSFRPTVTVSFNDGRAAVTSAPALIDVTSPSGAKARLTVRPIGESFLVGREIVLIASLAPPSKDVRYEFEWNDGSPAAAGDIRGQAGHRYTSAGAKTVLVRAYLGSADAEPLETTLVLAVEKPPGQSSTSAGRWWLLLIVIAVVFCAGWIVRKIHRPPSGEFHARAFAGPSEHTLQLNRTGSHVSLMLKPGMNSAEHNMIIPKKASAVHIGGPS